MASCSVSPDAVARTSGARAIHPLPGISSVVTAIRIVIIGWSQLVSIQRLDNVLHACPLSYPFRLGGTFLSSPLRRLRCHLPHTWEGVYWGPGPSAGFADTSP